MASKSQDMPTAERSQVAESRWLQEVFAFSGKKRKEAPGQQRKAFLVANEQQPIIMRLAPVRKSGSRARMLQTVPGEVSLVDCFFMQSSVS